MTCATEASKTSSFAVVDGLKGFPQAIEAAFYLQTRIQTPVSSICCAKIPIELRQPTRTARPSAAALKAIYTAVDADAAEGLALAEFEDSDLAKRYPAIRAELAAGPGTRVIPFLDYPPRGPQADLHHERH